MDGTTITCVSPITRLSVEILQHIFLQYVASFEHDVPPADYYSWTTILHVCAYWRAIAYDSPLLWSRIVFAGRYQWVQKCQALSKTAPITIDFSITGRTYQTLSLLLDILRDDLHRVRDIICHVMSMDVEPFREFANAFAGPAPLLRGINIFASMFTDRALRARRQEMVLSALTNRATCNVRRIELIHCLFPWKATVPFVSLRHLIISNAPLEPRYHDILATLAQLPLLEILELELTEPRTAPNLGAKTLEVHRLPHVVALPHLRTLRVEAHIRASSLLLQLLSFPSYTKMYFKFELTSDDDLIDFGKNFSSKLGNSPDVHTLYVQIPLHDGRTEIEGYEAERPFVFRDPESDVAIPRFGVSIWADAANQPVYQTLCNTLQLSGVCAFEIDGLVEEHPADVFGMVQGMQNVTTLRLWGSAGYALLGTATPNSDAKSFVLPALRTLELDYLRDELYNVGESDAEGKFYIARKTIRDILQKRQLCGVGIERLHILTYPDFLDARVDPLREFVGAVYGNRV